ncbi:MAG TPA: hypothetical protein VFR37_13575, partial [Longimicrobium sp.]|nr:hypothetical protein [Longimicrobium sp.]
WVPAAPPGGGASGPAGGDLDGSYPAPQVAGLRGNRIAEATPTEGQVLVFREDIKEWVPGAAGGAATDYEVVGAGRFEVPGSAAQAIEPPYNELGMEITDTALNLFVLIIKAEDYDPERFHYVVKALWAGGVVLLSTRPDSRGPQIRLVRLQEIPTEESELHVEVSRYSRIKQEEGDPSRGSIADAAAMDASASTRTAARKGAAPRKGAARTRTPKR